MILDVVWTQRSLRELSSIGDYINQYNPRAADRIVNEIYSRTQGLLSQNPLIGRPGDIDGTRELVLPDISYVVAYRVHSDRVEVLFVQHGARQWPEGP